VSSSFLGTGLKHPFRFERRTGAPGISTATSSDHAHIHESVLQILNTSIGERFMRPDFGSRLSDLVFETNGPVLRGLLRHHIADAIRKWEKRIAVTDIGFLESDEDIDLNRIRVRIAYRVIQTQVEGNLVYPFYRGEA